MKRLITTIAVLLALLLITSSNLIDLAYELINPAPLETIAMTSDEAEIMLRKLIRSCSGNIIANTVSCEKKSGC